MLAISHFIITALILFFGKKILGDISLAVIFLSYLFGVFIDLDHLIFHFQESVREFKKNLTGKFKERERGKKYLHSVFQEPWFFFALLIITTVLFLFTKKTEVFLPTFCLGTHIFFDALMDFDNFLLWPFSKKKFRGFIPSGTLVEIIVSIFLLVVFVFIF